MPVLGCQQPNQGIDRSEAGAGGISRSLSLAAGAYADIRAAAAAMGSVNSGVYQPIPENAATYDQLFMEYADLHDHFGRGGNDVMHKLKALRRTAVTGK